MVIDVIKSTLKIQIKQNNKNHLPDDFLNLTQVAWLELSTG